MNDLSQPSEKIGHPRQDEEVIDLRQYLQVIGNYKWRIFMLAIMVTLLTAVVTFSLTPIYRATATLLIEAEEAKAVSIEEVYGLDSSKQEYFLTQFEILKSRKLAGRVIDKLNLSTYSEFTPEEPIAWMADTKAFILSFIPLETELEALTEEEIAREAREALITDFVERLTISPIRKTQLVHISFEAEDRKLAALVANTLGEEYIDSYLEEKMGMTTKASDWIRGRLDGLRVQLVNSEKKLQLFREENGLVDVEGVVALTSQELNELTTQLSQARQKRVEAQGVVRLLEASGKSDIDRLVSMPEISGHQLIQRIKEEESEAENLVAELSKRYGPKHNKMIAAQARLKEIQTNLKRRVARLVEGIEQEYKTAIGNERSLKSDLSVVKTRYQGLSRIENQYRVLSRDVKTNRHLYDTFLQRMKETSVVGDFQAANARFTDLAQPPVEPAKPKKKMIITLAFVATLMLGVMLAFLLDALSDTIATADDVEGRLAQRVIGMIPQFKLQGNKELDVYAFFDEKAHKFSESWRTLRTGYVLSHIEQEAKVVSVTSTLPSEGKSTTSVNLAFALTQVEKVLLIDADMRRPSLGHRFGVPNYQPGLANLISGTHVFEDCVYKDERSNLDLLCAGSLVENPLELLSHPEFKTLIMQLRDKYDRIVIDTPPAHVVSDAMVVAKTTDSLIYVVRAGHIRRKLVQETIAKLQGLKTRIDGVVLNRISEKANKAYYGYDYDGYYSYSYASSKGRKKRSDKKGPAEAA